MSRHPDLPAPTSGEERLLTGPLSRTRGKHRLSTVTTRLVQLPGREEAAGFLAELRRPARVSATRAVVDGLIVAMTLRKRGVRSLLPAAAAPSPGVDTDRSAEVARAVDAGLALLPLAPTCLRRSVTLLRELNRLGLAAEMHVGVRTVAGTVEAHAWVQAGDVVVNDDPDVTKTYVELAAGDLERIVPMVP